MCTNALCSYTVKHVYSNQLRNVICGLIKEAAILQG